MENFNSTRETKDTNDDELDLKDLILLLLNYKFFVITFTSVGIILSILFSLTLQNTYISYAKVIPVSEDDNMSSQASQFTGLASLAGLDIDSGSSKSQEGIEVLKSFKFFNNHINSINVASNLLSSKSWDPKTNEIMYDSSYDINKNIWASEIPSNRKIFRSFESKFDIIEDSKSPVIILSFEHISPVFAKNILDKIILNINESTRDFEKQEAMKSINYLNKQMAKTNINEIKDVLSGLLRNEIQKTVLVEAREEFIFQTIDPPYVPEIKSGPNRSLICIGGAFISFIFSILLIMSYHFYLSFFKELE